MNIRNNTLLILSLLLISFSTQSKDIEVNTKWKSDYCIEQLCTGNHVPYNDFNAPMIMAPEIQKNNLWNFWQASKSNKKDFKLKKKL
jgi:hypothetical protein